MEYKISYCLIPNMGDLLNKDMLEALFGISVKRCNMSDGNMLAIGSGLKSLLYSDNPKTYVKQRILRVLKREPFYVWGTGFMNWNSGKDNDIRFSNVHFLSLRGELSRRRIEKILGRDLNVPLGDGGLLAEKWLGYTPEKKYRLGIIPHFKEKDSSQIAEMKSKYQDSTIIDLCEPPIEVVKKIASCETILSSSLHGLIVSDSFHIPNQHILLYPFGERMVGDGYKFSDYYSSYGLKDTPIIMDQIKNWPSITEIERSYQIDSKIVEQKKNQIFLAFPR